MSECSDTLVSHPLLCGPGWWSLEDKIVLNNTLSTKHAVPSGHRRSSYYCIDKGLCPSGIMS